jgi:Domain of unknown function (DUF2017)
MKRFRVTPQGIIREFSDIEAEVLSDIVDQMDALFQGERDGDPALERLLPDGYRNSPEDADEFRRFTQTELVDEKRASAHIVSRSLTGRTAKGAVMVTLDPGEAFAWLRALNDIRLALAARLGIVDEAFVPEKDDQTFAVYLWVGQLQHSLLRAVDR